MARRSRSASRSPGTRSASTLEMTSRPRTRSPVGRRRFPTGSTVSIDVGPMTGKVYQYLGTGDGHRLRLHDASSPARAVQYKRVRTSTRPVYQFTKKEKVTSPNLATEVYTDITRWRLVTNALERQDFTTRRQVAGDHDATADPGSGIRPQLRASTPAGPSPRRRRRSRHRRNRRRRLGRGLGLRRRRRLRIGRAVRAQSQRDRDAVARLHPMAAGRSGSNAGKSPSPRPTSPRSRPTSEQRRLPARSGWLSASPISIAVALAENEISNEVPRIRATQ